MELSVSEKTKDGIKVEVGGETHTLLNLIRENTAKAGAGQVSYAIEHPYMSSPKLTVKSGQPKKLLKEAAEKVAEDAGKFRKAFEAELK